LVALALTFGAPALKDKPGPEPTLIGEWIPESVTVNGNSADFSRDQWVFRADGTYAVYAPRKETELGAFTWDPKGSPGTVDLAVTSAPRPVILCRYQLDGDTLVLSIGHDPDVRPADVQPAKRTTVLVFKRVKKKD
jgi:uncharacterized protein (TIGR03067 family)